MTPETATGWLTVLDKVGFCVAGWLIAGVLGYVVLTLIRREWQRQTISEERREREIQAKLKLATVVKQQTDFLRSKL